MTEVVYEPEPRGATEVEADFAATRMPPRPTGRKLVVFHPDVGTNQAKNLLEQVTGAPVMSAQAAHSTDRHAKAAASGEAIVLTNRFGVAAIGGGEEQASAFGAALSALDEVIDVRPEFWMFEVAGPPWHDSAASTWGVEATGAIASQYDGEGIRVAVLDTGIDANHPDFAGRTIVTQSFVADGTVNDIRGHGTHCAGTALGRTNGGGNIPRYGVAPGASLYVAKVLNNQGAGREADIIDAIEWALEQECRVISMSLGRPVGIDEDFDPLYDDIGRRSLEAGALLVAAAGNESDRRYGYVAPVSSPANAPSIMAVAAIGSDEGVASFSCGGTGTGAVDVAAPGVGIFSSVPGVRLYTKMMGTSMACPHVAGLAALWAQSNRGLRGRALWDALVTRARSLPHGAVDVGAGLAIAP